MGGVGAVSKPDCTRLPFIRGIQRGFVSSRKYAIIGFSVVLVTMLFLSFSGDVEDDGYDMTGIVHDVKKSDSGFVFYLDTVDETFRCFDEACPVELGFYGVRGSFSDDGSIFFIESISCLD